MRNKYSWPPRKVLTSVIFAILVDPENVRVISSDSKGWLSPIRSGVI